MMRKAMKAGIALLGAMVILTGCGVQRDDQNSSETQVEGLEELGNIRVVSREEGSGTRSTFAELADFADSGEQSDLTTSDAELAENAEEVMKLVSADKAAIGYVSEGALTESADVKSLTVNGVSVDENNRYPLSRFFYLAYSGTLSELEQDFLMYVHGAGQEIVGEAYEPVAKSGSFLSNQAAGSGVMTRKRRFGRQRN